MTYHEDLRKRARCYINDGGSLTKASSIFGVGKTTIHRWLKDLSPAKKPGRIGPDKIDTATLLKDVRAHPDKLLRERAIIFDVTTAGISAALKRLHIKKNTKISGKKA